MARLRIGARKSLLAQTQSRWVGDQIRRHAPELQIEFVLITTTGDQISIPSPLVGEVAKTSGDSPDVWRGGGEGGLKAMFTKEIEEALLNGSIDLAVHSMKDMPAELPKGLVIGAVPVREDPRDAWISRDGRPFREARPGARIGTGAVRRQAQLRHARPDLEMIALRGNVDTRLRKLTQAVAPAGLLRRSSRFGCEGWKAGVQSIGLDGLILALAGLKRLGREKEATEILPFELLLPAVGQGALAIEVRQEDAQSAYLAAIDHGPSHQAVRAERAFLKALGGTCQTPIAAHADLSSGSLVLQGLVVSPDGQRLIRETETGKPEEASILGTRLAEKLLAAGANEILR